MLPKMLTLFCSVIFKIFKGVGTAEDFIIIHPERQIATLNSVITLQCRVKVFDKYEVHWVKDGFGLGNTRIDIRQYGKPVNNQHRYDLPYNLDEGQYDLRITDLNLSDEGVFYCQIVVDGREFSSRKATVQVLVPSDAPEFIQINNEGKGPKEKRNEKNPIIVNDGDFLFIKCIAKNGRPGAFLHWFLNDIEIPIQPNGEINGTLMGKVSISSELTEKYGKLYNVESFLKLKINSLKHGNWLKCLAKNRGYENEKLKFAVSQIEVHTIPVVNIVIYPSRSQHTYMENDLIELSCTASGRPNSFYWKWFINNSPVENILESKYKLQITRSHHKATIKCEAISTREGSKSIQIYVKYGPEFKNRDSLMYPASVGDTVKMSCEADGNPSPSIYWQRQFSDVIIERGPVLIKKEIQAEDFGVYRCTATVPEFDAVEKFVYLERKKEPRITHHPVTYGRDNQNVRLSCSIESVPLPNDNEIKWFYKNKHIIENNRYKTYKESFRGGVVAILQIQSIQSNDYGDYNCTVKTGLGIDTSTVTLIKKGEIPIFMIVGATIIFLFILLVTTVVLCIFQRKKLKDDYLKGNPSRPELPLPHETKPTLTDSDCRCHPNLYNWMPQSFDLKSQNDILNKMHYQNANLWPRSHELESCYSNSTLDNLSGSKSAKISKKETINTNSILYNIQTLGSNTLTRFPSNLPFSDLTIEGEKDSRFCDSSQYPQYAYPDMIHSMGDHSNKLKQIESPASPIYIVKKLKSIKPNFPEDCSSNSIIKSNLNKCTTNISMYPEQQNTKLV